MTLLRTLLLWLVLWPVLIVYYPVRWLWRKLFRRKRSAGAFWIDVVGESQYYDNLRKICGNGNESADVEKMATLVLEAANPVDANAVRVDIDGRTVGYLPRESAGLFRNVFLKRKTKEIGGLPARIRGGWRDKKSTGNYGVKLRIDN